MKFDEKMACLLNAAIGGVIGWLIYFVAQGGWVKLLMPAKGARWWNSDYFFYGCIIFGVVMGALSVIYKHYEISEEAQERYWQAGILFIFGIGLYMLWELAKGV